MKLLVFMYLVFTGNICGQNQYFDVCSTSSQEVITAGVGYIVSPGYSTGGYPDNKNCSVTIPGAGKIIKLSIVELNMQFGVDCTNDWLKIFKNDEEFSCYNGVTNLLPIIKEFKLDNVTIHFYSNHFNFENWIGFRIQFLVQEPFVDICQCDAVTVSHDMYITSPNYPMNHPTSRYCSVNVMAPAGNLLKIQPITFAVPCSEAYGNLLIIEQSWDNKNEICGIDAQFCILSSTNSVQITFILQHMNTAKGFSLLIKVLPSDTTAESECPPSTTSEPTLTTSTVLMTTQSVTAPSTTTVTTSTMVTTTQSVTAPRTTTSTISKHTTTQALDKSTTYSPFTTTKVPTMTTQYSNSILNETTTEILQSSTMFDENINNSDNEAGAQQASSTGTIIGSIVGGILFTLTIIVLVIFGVCRWRKHRLDIKDSKLKNQATSTAKESPKSAKITTDSALYINGEFTSENIVLPYIDDIRTKLQAKKQTVTKLGGNYENDNYAYDSVHENINYTDEFEGIYVDGENIYPRSQENTLTSEKDEVEMIENDLYSESDISDNSNQMEMIDNDLYNSSSDTSDESDHVEMIDNDIYSS